MRTVSTSNKFWVNQKVRVNLPGNQYDGQIFTTKLYYASNPAGWYMLEQNLLFYENQIEPVEMTREFINEQINGIKKQQEELNGKIKVYEQQLAYLDETGQNSFDDTEFKAYYALKVIETENMSIVERAKAIANLINMAK